MSGAPGAIGAWQMIAARCRRGRKGDDGAADAGAWIRRRHDLGRVDARAEAGQEVGVVARSGLVVVVVVAACARSNPNADAETGVAVAGAREDAREDAGASADANASGGVRSGAGVGGEGGVVSEDPFGRARMMARTSCTGVAGKHVAERDLRTSFVSGEDLLAIVNRSPTGQLAPDWAPSDLVDLRTGHAAPASECDKIQCLRKEAASALTELLASMKKRGFPGKVESAFRGYGTQCGTFLRWAQKGGFCEATEQSALPGHSQHQLGTTVDLFTEEWAKDERGVFREGFGCTPAGRFLQEHATDAGFVMPYPIHPDDRHPKQSCAVRWDIPININPKTGYRFEHWHLRYVGKDAAARFAKAFAASGAGSPNEISVEQWLRAEKGLAGPDAELPVCDGCNCGACSTLSAPGENACDKKGGAIHLDEHGRALSQPNAPQIASAQRGTSKKWKGALVEVSLTIPDGLATQPPFVGPDGAGYVMGATYEKLSPYPETSPRAFSPLASAWVIGIEPIPNDTGTAWPWRAGLGFTTVGQTYNRANVLLPAHPGSLSSKVPIPAGASKVRVILIEGGIPRGEPRTVELH